MRKNSVPFFFVFGLILFSCNNTPKKFEFYYYPARNIYYDVTNKLYLYSLNGGKTWDSLHTNINAEPAVLGTKKIVYSTTHEIWKDNAAHLQQYNGHIINITSEDSLSQANLAADRKIKKVKKPVVTPEKKPDKKPGFFKRLFGKKN